MNKLRAPQDPRIGRDMNDRLVQCQRLLMFLMQLDQFMQGVHVFLFRPSATWPTVQFTLLTCMYE